MVQETDFVRVIHSLTTHLLAHYTPTPFSRLYVTSAVLSLKITSCMTCQMSLLFYKRLKHTNCYVEYAFIAV